MYNRSMPFPENHDLSERELDILRLVAQGLSNKEIAQQLFISPNTVKVHLRNIFAKIGVLSRTEAALYALKHGLVTTSAPEPSLGLPISTVEPASAEENPSQGGPRKQSRRWVFWTLLVGLVLLVILLGLELANQVLAPEPTPLSTQAEAAFPLVITPTPTPPPRWKTLPPMPSPASKLAAASANGLIYAVGGETDQGVSASLEIYDPASGTWREGKPKPIAASEIQAVALGGKIYIPGGRLANGEASPAFEIYDPLHDTWEAGPDLPYPVSAYALAAFEGKLFLFGGWDGKTIFDRVLEFDPSAGEWIERSPLPSPRLYAGAASARGRIYVLGGFDGQNALSSNLVYSPSLEDSGSSPWDTASSLPNGRYGMGVVSIADTILIIGGVGDPPADADSFHFFPSLGTWVKLEQPSELSWAYLSAVPLDQNIFALGGQLDEQVSDLLKTYQAVYTILIPVVP
jgi:DNA-binding CsgD family transcriptional regulator